MRLLQVRPIGDEDSTLDLHPMLTVVTGLSREARAALLAAVAALPGGDDPGMAGTVEAHGVLLDLNAATLDLLDMSSPIDVVVRSEDLPGADDGGSGHGDEGSTNGTDGNGTQATAPAPESDELSRSRSSLHETSTALKAIVDAMNLVRAEHHGAVAARTALQDELADVERHLDPQAAEHLEVARRTVQSLETELGLEPGTSVLGGEESLDERRTRLLQQLADFDRVLAAYDAIDTAPVIEAMHLVREVTASGPIPSPRALALADEWIGLQEYLAAVEARLEAEGGGTESATARLDAARARLAAAEEAVKPKVVSSDDVAALEAAHDVVLEAEERASGRLMGNRAKRGLEEAREAEQVILDRMGHPTWSSYVMSAGVAQSSPDAERRLIEAQEELEGAESQWADLASRLEDDPEFAGLLDQLEVVYAEAVELVGEVKDIDVALREYRIDPSNPSVSREEAGRRLTESLRGAGLEVADGVELELLRERAERWLVEVRSIAPQRQQVEIDRERCQQEIEGLADLIGRVDAGDEVPSVQLDDPRLDDARARVMSCESRLENHRKALERYNQLADEVERIRETEHGLAEQLEAKEELIEATRMLEKMAEAKVARLESAPVTPSGPELIIPESHGMDQLPSVGGAGETNEESDWYLLGRLSESRKVSYAGSVPMVFDDPLVDIAPERLGGLLRTVERMSQTVQVVYLTDQRNVIEWARGLGEARAAVVRGTGYFG